MMGEKISREALIAGQVDLSDVTTGEDAALGPFLNFLAHDLVSHPERLQTMDTALMKRLQSLVGDAKIDLNAALTVDDE